MALGTKLCVSMQSFHYMFTNPDAIHNLLLTNAHVRTGGFWLWFGSWYILKWEPEEKRKDEGLLPYRSGEKVWWSRCHVRWRALFSPSAHFREVCSHPVPKRRHHFHFLTGGITVRLLIRWRTAKFGSVKCKIWAPSHPDTVTEKRSSGRTDWREQSSIWGREFLIRGDEALR